MPLETPLTAQKGRRIVIEDLSLLIKTSHLTLSYVTLKSFSYSLQGTCLDNLKKKLIIAYIPLQIITYTSPMAK